MKKKKDIQCNELVLLFVLKESLNLVIGDVTSAIRSYMEEKKRGDLWVEGRASQNLYLTWC